MVLRLWILIATAIASSWAARVNLNERVSLLKSTAGHTALEETNEPKKQKRPVRWFKKRLEDMFGLEPGTLATVNMARTDIAQRFEGRWFGVHDNGAQPEDFWVIDIEIVNEGTALRVTSSNGLGGEISREQVVEAGRQPSTVFQIQTPEGDDTMYLSFNVQDKTFNSLVMVPAEAEETTDGDELIVLFKVSDWLARKPRRVRKAMYDTLSAASKKLSNIPLPTPAEAQELLPRASDMPDWMRNAYGPRGEFAGGNVPAGPHRDATLTEPVRSAMKGARQAEKDEEEPPKKKRGVTFA